MTKGHRYTLPLLGVTNPLLANPMDNLDTDIIVHDRNLIIMSSS